MAPWWRSLSRLSQEQIVAAITGAEFGGITRGADLTDAARVESEMAQ